MLILLYIAGKLLFVLQKFSCDFGLQPQKEDICLQNSPVETSEENSCFTLKEEHCKPVNRADET